MPPFYRPLLSICAVILTTTAFTGCSAEAKKTKLLDQANRHYDAGDYDKAEIEYLNLLQLQALHPTAISRLGVIYSHQGRMGRVFPFLTKARELQPDNLEVRMRLAMLYAAGGRMKEARDEVLFVLDRKPQDEEAPILFAESAVQPVEIEATRRRLQNVPAPTAAPIHVALGLLDLRERKPKEAQAAFERALSADPKSSSAHLALGTLFWSQNDLPRAEAALAAAAKLSTPRSPKRIRYAQFSRQTGKIDVARRTLEEITQEVPDCLPAWLLLADIAAGEQKYDESLSLLGKVLARDANHPEAMLLSARVRLAKGEKDKAVAELERAAKIFPQSAPVHLQLGLAYVANGELGKAATSLAQAVTIAPGFPNAILALAEINIRQGNAAAAVTALKQLIQQQPRLEQARLLLAQAHRSQKKLDEALDVYRQLDEAFPRNPQTSMLIALVLLEQNKKDLAREQLQRALEFAPDFVPATEQLVNMDIEAKDFAGARKRIEEQIARRPQVPELHLVLAKIFLAQADTKQAETALLKVIELRPDLPLPYFLLARLYLSSKQHQKALANLEQAAAANPKGVDALMLIGVIHDQQKNYAAARQSYEKLLAINPKFSAALNNLAYLYSEHFNELDKAFEMAQRARELLPREAHTADTLGWILYKRNQYSWALTLLAESAEKLPNSPEVQFHLGMTHYMMGEETSARAALGRALNLSKDFDGQEEAREALSLLDIDPTMAGTDVQAALEKKISKRQDPVALSRLGALYDRSGADAKAAAAYEAALKISPNNVSAALGLVRVYAKRKETAKALELAKATRKLAPTDPDVAHALGRLVFETGDFSWSHSLLQEAVRKKPEDPALQHAFGEASYSIGLVSAAETALRTSLESSAVSTHALRAREFLEKISWSTDPRKAAAAKNRIEETLKTDPQDVPALMALGVFREMSQDSRGAREAFEKALARYPDFSPAKRRLAIIYATNPENDKKALETATKAREAYPDDPDVAKALGIILFRQQNYQRAVSLLQESGRRLTEDSEVMYYLGMAQHHSKDAVGSKRSLQRSLDLGLRNELAAEAKTILTK